MNENEYRVEMLIFVLNIKVIDLAFNVWKISNKKVTDFTDADDL